jgi:hypothetical protein
VVLMGWRLGYSWRDIRGLTLIFATFGLLMSVAGWVVYNYLIFDNPLNFENGPDSSAAQMADRHTSIVAESWSLTLKGYSYAVASDLCLAMVALAAIGLIVFLRTERFSARSLPVLGLLTIVPFFLYSLKAGAEPISVPQPDGFLLNYRFGLIVAMPAAILIGYLLSRLPGKALLPASAACILGLALLSGQSFARHQVVLATEAAQDLYVQRDQVATGIFLVQRTSGLILLDIVQNERVDFDVVDRTVYDGTKESGHNQWHAVLQNPEAFGIRVIVMRLPSPSEPVDAVYAALHNSPLLHPYHLVYRSPSYSIYTVNSPPGAGRA